MGALYRLNGAQKISGYCPFQMEGIPVADAILSQIISLGFIFMFY